MREEIKRLTRKKDDLVKMLKDLEKNKEKFDQKEYETEKRAIERQLVEVCDRLVQYRYVLKGGI